MEIGEHDEGPEMPSPMSSSFMPSSMHETAAAATSAKMKVVLTASGGNSLTGGGGNINGVNSSNGMTTGSIANNGLTSGATHGLSHGPNQVSHHGSHMDDVRVPASMELKVRKPVKYRECLKNHAANLGSHATDGCGEFMPSGEEGTLEALTCAACNCHRNFHRREVEGELPVCADCRYHGRKRMDSRFPSPLPLSSPTLLNPPPHMIMAFNPVAAPDSDEFDGGLMSPQSSSLKKRFRTKFTPEQKEQMASFAQKLGWRIQKHDEEAVQQFCADIGVKRQVLKVWMHNNKLTVGKKITGCLTMTPENPEI